MIGGWRFWKRPRPDSSMPAVELISATIKFNAGTVNEVRVLTDINLSLPQGANVLITGANGSGKSSLLKAISGQIRLASGCVRLHGIDVTAWPMHKRARFVASVHQDPLLSTSPNLSVYDNLDLAASLPWWSVTPRAFQLTADQLKAVSDPALCLTDKVARPISAMSGGQRQFIALNLQKLQKFKSIFLLDEFISALDDKAACSAIAYMAAIYHSGKTVISVSHGRQLDGGCITHSIDVGQWREG